MHLTNQKNNELKKEVIKFEKHAAKPVCFFYACYLFVFHNETIIELPQKR